MELLDPGSSLPFSQEIEALALGSDIRSDDGGGLSISKGAATMTAPRTMEEAVSFLETWRKENELDRGWEVISPSINLQAWARAFVEHQEIYRTQGKTVRNALLALCAELEK